MIDHKYFKSFDMNDRLYCNVAVAIVGAGVVGAAGTAYAASKAADAQTAAADKAQATQMAMYDTTRGDLAPYRDMGVSAGTELQSRLKELTSPIIMDQATLEKTPGYQFNRTQGLKSVQNSAAARGLGSSGAALKGAAAFATGLADNTYQNQFQNAVTNQTNAYSRLKGLIDTGENAAAQTGALGEKAAYNSGQAQIGAGNAQAAGYNAMGGAVANAANSVASGYIYNGLYGGKGGSGPITYGGPSGPTPFT